MYKPHKDILVNGINMIIIMKMIMKIIITAYILYIWKYCYPCPPLQYSNSDEEIITTEKQH